jgi:hypothetical protein
MKAVSRIFLAINVLSLCVVLRQCSVIHSDGPGGFGELIVKGMLAQVSILCFIFFIVSFRRLSKNAAGRRLATFGIYLTTSVLLFSFILSLVDACDNEKGFCKNWNVVLGYKPNNSFKPTPLRSAA